MGDAEKYDGEEVLKRMCGIFFFIILLRISEKFIEIVMNFKLVIIIEVNILFIVPVPIPRFHRLK